MIFSFVLQSFSFLTPSLGPNHLPGLEFSSTFCRSLVPMGSGMQQFISFGPILCLAYPEHFLHHLRTSLPVHSSYQDMTSQLSSFPLLHAFWQRILVVNIFLASSCICFLFHISHFDTCPLPHTNLFDASFPHSSCQRKLFTVLPLFYKAVEAGRILQCCIHLFSFLLHGFCSCFFVQHCSCFCQLISLLIAFADKPLKRLYMFMFFHRAVRLIMLYLYRHMSIHIDVPIIVNAALLQHVQVCMCYSGHVKVF